MQGCPLRCVYCHNPDTWECNESQLTDANELAERLLSFYSFIKNGGVTFSGGEPLLQAEFITEVASILKKAGYDGTICLEFEGMEDVIDALQIGLENLHSYISTLK